MASYEKAAVVATLKNIADAYRAKADAEAAQQRLNAERNLAAIDTERLAADLSKVRQSVVRGRKPTMPITGYSGDSTLSGRLGKWANALSEAKKEFKPNYAKAEQVERVITMVDGIIGDTVPVTDLRTFGALALLRVS